MGTSRLTQGQMTVGIGAWLVLPATAAIGFGGLRGDARVGGSR